MSLIKTRNIRAPPNVPKVSSSSSAIVPHPHPGPSNISLFLTNLRLLNLDLKEDWPEINSLTFSTKNAQQNQKKRIRCVEWALYQLFSLWDPEECCNKLQPFFPPLEPLQSLNLRNALFRCLDQARKNGTLSQDTVLRKTMLDECKGEKLEEILAIFSNMVLKKVLRQRDSQCHESIAHQLAHKSFSYTGERSLLSSLIIAHKASLCKYLGDKKELRTKYRSFSDLLDVIDRRLERQQEELNYTTDKSIHQFQNLEKQTQEFQEQAIAKVSGYPEWLQDVLSGDKSLGNHYLLSLRFNDVWDHVEKGTLDIIECKRNLGLVEQINIKLKEQQRRLVKWQEFEDRLKKIRKSLPIQPVCTIPVNHEGIDLGFTKHQDLQIGNSSSNIVPRPKFNPTEEYSQFINNMKLELSRVGKPQIESKIFHRTVQNFERQAPSKVQASCNKIIESSKSVNDLTSDSDSEIRPTPQDYSCKNIPVNEAFKSSEDFKEQKLDEKLLIQDKQTSKSDLKIPENDSKSLRQSNNIFCESQNKISSFKCREDDESESDLANQILNSVSLASPSPKKPLRTLSLAERTRMSMARATQPNSSELHEVLSKSSQLPTLSLKSNSLIPVKLPKPKVESDSNFDLSQRTRKSMAGFEAAQKQAQLNRRISLKESKKLQRENSHFRRVEEATSPVTNNIDLIEGDPDYESVFMSRPKVKTSPIPSPDQAFSDNEEM